MIAYALIDKNTNNVLNTFSWGNEEISKDYPIEDTQTILKLEDENIYKSIQNNFKEGKQSKLKNSSATTFEEMFEIRDVSESLPQPNQDNYLVDLDYRISKIELGL